MAHAEGNPQAGEVGFSGRGIHELLEAARVYSVAYDRYHAACTRLAIARNNTDVPAAEWDEPTSEACRALHAARDKMQTLAEQMFPQDEQAKAWKDYMAHFYGTTAVSF
jgi:hypothetical protein